jgi:transcriptional regulator with XRE-family HTH domain
MDKFYLEFGRMIRAQRNETDLTQTDLAERVGLSRTSITNIELGRQHISLHHLYALASALGTTPEKLLPAQNLAKETLLTVTATKALKKQELPDTQLRWIERLLRVPTNPEGAPNDATQESTRRSRRSS